MITVTEDSLRSIKEQVKAANMSLEHPHSEECESVSNNVLIDLGSHDLISFLARHIVACIRENKHTV